MAPTVNNLPEVQESQVPSLGREDPLEKECLPTPVFLPGDSKGREPGGLQSAGSQELDTTERLPRQHVSVPLSSRDRENVCGHNSLGGRDTSAGKRLRVCLRFHILHIPSLKDVS